MPLRAGAAYRRPVNAPGARHGQVHRQRPRRNQHAERRGGRRPQAALPPGRHRFSLVVVDDSGNESTPDTVDVIVADRDRPTAVLQGPDVASAGKPFTLSGARSFDTGGGIIKTWRFTYLGLATR